MTVSSMASVATGRAAGAPDGGRDLDSGHDLARLAGVPCDARVDEPGHPVRLGKGGDYFNRRVHVILQVNTAREDAP